MITNTLPKEQSIYLLLYNIEDADLCKFESMVGSYISDVSALLKQKENVINKVLPSEFSQVQKLLITLYLHLYAVLHSRDLFGDERLTNIRKKLDISDSFTRMSFQSMKQLNPNSILNGRTPIESIIEPTNEVIMWSTNVVYQALCEGRYINKKKIIGLDPSEYEHPIDKQALDALEGTPGLEMLVKKFNQYGIERLMKIQYTGSNIKVHERNFPQLHNALRTACEVLNFHTTPDLYIELGFINAKTMGVEKPIIVITSGCVGLLTYDELLFVLGHEAGHIKSQHILYHQMAGVFPIIGDIVSSVTLGIGGIVSKGIEIALLNWQRKSEFTSDRAGLLACQNVEAATTAMMKIAGVPPKYYQSINPKDFEKQAKEFEEFDTNKLDKIAKYISVMFADHPWTVMRGHELYKWVEAGEYDGILNRHSSRRLKSDSINAISGMATKTMNQKFCTKCGNPFTDDENFCTNCGKPKQPNLNEREYP